MNKLIRAIHSLEKFGNVRFFAWHGTKDAPNRRRVADNGMKAVQIDFEPKIYERLSKAAAKRNMGRGPFCKTMIVRDLPKIESDELWIVNGELVEKPALAGGKR